MKSVGASLLAIGLTRHGQCIGNPRLTRPTARSEMAGTAAFVMTTAATSAVPATAVTARAPEWPAA